MKSHNQFFPRRKMVIFAEGHVLMSLTYMRKIMKKINLINTFMEYV